MGMELADSRDMALRWPLGIGVQTVANTTARLAGPAKKSG